MGVTTAPLVSVLPIEVAWGDCDPAEIVFYPNYFAWFDAATWRLFAAAGLSRRTLLEEFGVAGHPLVEATSRFLGSAAFGDRLSIASRIEHWGTKSFRVLHQVSGADGSLKAEGRESRVWAMADPDHPGKLKGFAIPGEVIRRFGG